MKRKSYDNASLALHRAKRGKLAVTSLVPLRTRDDLSLAYTPGVAAVSRAIARDARRARELTMSGRTIAVVSDGSAVLGLGNVGPEAALPVMEGKAVLFKEFAGLDAVPLVLRTQDVDEIVRTVLAIAPTFAGINLEDIAAPRCFEVERRLIAALDIPVMHDDQHGTAIVVLAALTNALAAVGKKLPRANIVISGAGAAATATVHLLAKAGAAPGRIITLDSKGILFRGRPGLSPEKRALAARTNGKRMRGGLPEALEGADVFLGMSKGNVLAPEWVERMAERPIIFAMANPEPEISYDAAKRTKAAVIGTGRSDFPNQINNVLAFPGVFRGAVDARARRVTDAMKLAAAKAIAGLVPRREVRRGIVVPSALDRRVAPAVARAVARAARRKV